MPVGDFCRTIEIPMPVTFGSVNVYLIPEGAGAVLIDTGMNHPSSLSFLEASLAAEGLTLADIRLVLCTHHHPDHAGLSATLQKSGARVLISEADSVVLSYLFANPEQDDARIRFWGHHRLPQDSLDRVGGMNQTLRSLHGAFTPDGTFGEGDCFSVGDVSLEVCMCPGHTPGHAVFVCHERKTVFTGDHLLEDQVSSVSFRDQQDGREMLGATLESLEKLARFSGYVGLSGHGAPIPDVAVRADHTVRFHRSRLTRLLNVLSDTPEHADTLGIAAFGEKRRVYSRWLSLASTIAGLDHLVATGMARASQSAEGFQLYTRIR